MSRPIAFLKMLFVVALVSSAAAQTLPADVAIAVDVTRKRQIMEGFGATTLALVYGGWDAAGYDDVDNLPELRAKATEALYGQIRLTMGNLQLPMLEPHNDDDDPRHFTWTGFDLRESRFMKDKIVDLGRPYGFDDFQLAPDIDLRRMSWLKLIRDRNYLDYIEECAEHITAAAIYWRDTWRIVPPLIMPFNEPLSGNRELVGGSTQEVVDIVKRAGARLRQAGFATVKFVIPNEETEETSLETATAVLSDPDARQFVGAIGYHPYPYGSQYASVPSILNTSGKGSPDVSRIEIRRKLRELGRRFNLPLWMTEVSHSEVPQDSMDAVRGRAIHIHDEFEYADAAAFFGMNAMWDTKSHREHTHGSRPFESETDTLVLINNEAGKVTITSTGYAIGHYARWVRRGDSRVEATSSDPLVEVSAFANAAATRVAFVLINNAPDERRVVVSLKGSRFNKPVSGERSGGERRWQPLAPIAAEDGKVRLVLEPQSVTSLGERQRDAGGRNGVSAGAPPDQ